MVWYADCWWKWFPTTSQHIIPSTALLCSTIHCEKKKLMPDYQSAYRTTYSTSLLHRSLWKEETDAQLPVSLSYHVQRFSAPTFTVKRRNWCPTTSQLIILSTSFLCSTIHCEKKKMMSDYQSAYCRSSVDGTISWLVVGHQFLLFTVSGRAENCCRWYDKLTGSRAPVSSFHSER